MNKILLATIALCIPVATLAQNRPTFDCQGAIHGEKVRFVFSLSNDGAKLGYVSDFKPYFYTGKADLTRTDATGRTCSANLLCYSFQELQSELDNYKNGHITIESRLIEKGAGWVYLAGDDGQGSSYELMTLSCEVRK